MGGRVGVGWLFSACGDCVYCRCGRENLCEQFTATGRDANGGYAEYLVVPEESVFPIPEVFADQEAAPLLCGGAVGYRALRMARLTPGQSLGFYGFGSSAHLVLPMARHLYPDTPLFVFTRSEDKQQFAKDLGAHWTGPPGAKPPQRPDAIIDTTPVWSAVELSMRILAPGGRLVINAIRKTDDDRDSLLKMDYATHLWMEKTLVTVANVTAEDIGGALALAARIPLRPTVETYPLGDANRALIDLAEGRGRGAKVLSI